jgi:hypothetical protein
MKGPLIYGTFMFVLSFDVAPYCRKKVVKITDNRI